MFDLRSAERRRFLGAAGLALAAAWIGTRDSVLEMIKEPFRGSNGRDLASLGRATAWLHSTPLTAADLRGKVVLVDFCTYTCINWLRTLPYVRAWAERYKEHGLVVLGVHTPEHHCRHQARSQTNGRGRHIPPGPVLPLERAAGRAAAAA